jgi:small subunit ribosomal protein S2
MQSNKINKEYSLGDSDILYSSLDIENKNNGRLRNFDIYNTDNLYNNRFQIGQTLVRWNSKMSVYVLYKNKTFHVFDLFKTMNNLKSSVLFLTVVALNRGQIITIDANKKYKDLFLHFKNLTGQMFFNFKWIGGLLTNFKEFFFRQNKEKKNADIDEFWVYKQEGFFRNLTRMPDCVIFLNTYLNSVALSECQILGIPNICIVNTDCDPSFINFVLANKDNNFLISFFYMSVFIESILLGYMLERKLYTNIIKHYFYLLFLKKLKKEI